jgi:hypothetical protein
MINLKSIRSMFTCETPVKACGGVACGRAAGELLLEELYEVVPEGKRHAHSSRPWPSRVQDQHRRYSLGHHGRHRPA